MDYKKIYEAIVLIYKRTPPLPDEYSEVHHIIPRCLGGEDAEYNLVRLPARHHFVAHLCLAKIHGGKLAHAAYRMSNYGKYGNRRYAWLRKRNAEALRGNKFSLGVRPSPETRAKLSAARMGNKNAAGNKGRPAANKGKRHSAETIQKMSEAHRGNKPSPRHIEVLRARSIGNDYGKANKGLKRGPMSEEHKNKIAARMREIRATKRWRSR